MAEYYCVKVQCMLHWSPVGKKKNCGELKMHGKWYGQRGVLCECQFWVFSSLIVWGEKLSLSRLVRVRTVYGLGGWSHWWSSRLSSYTAWCRCPGGREAHLQQCGGQFAQPFAELCECCWCSFHTRQWCCQSGCFPQCRCRMSGGCGDSF